MILPRSSTLFLAATFCLASLPSFAEEIRPARFYYGYHAFGNAINHVAPLRERYHVMVYHMQDEPLLKVDAAKFPLYGSVFICGKQRPEPFNEEESRQVEEFVRNGGNLVLVGNAAKEFPAEAGQRLTGLIPMDGAYPLPSEVVAQEHPLFSGMDQGVFHVMPVSQGEAGATPLLLSRGRYAAVAENRLGKGRVISVSESLFPPYGQQRAAGVIPKESIEPRAETFIKNLLNYLDVPSLADAVSAGVPSGPQLLLWHRLPDHEIFSGARRMQPPYPVNESEHLEKLTATVGTHEVEYLPLYLTYREGSGPVTLALEGEAAGKFRLLSLGGVEGEAAGPEVFVKEHSRDTAGRFTIEASAGADTLTFLLRLDSKGLPPGTHTCQLTVERGGLRQTVPVELRVVDVALPDYRLHHVEIEHNDLARQVRSMTGTAPDKMAKALANLRDAGSNHIMGWPYPPEGVHAKTLDGQTPLASVIVPENRAQIEGGTLPNVDYSWANSYFDAAADSGMVIFRSYNYTDSEKLLGLLRSVYGERKLTPSDPEALPFLLWDVRQRRIYLKEKGYAMAYLKWGDEWGPQKLEEITTATTPLRKLGWKVALNPNGKTVLSSPEFRRKVIAGGDILQARDPYSYLTVQEMSADRKLIPPDGLMWILTSSWWWNQSSTAGYLYGYAMANAGVRGAHFHGWWRSKPNPFMGVYLHRDTFEINPSIGMLAFGKGLQDSEYATLAYQWIRRGEKLGKEMKPMRQRLAAIIGNPDAIIPMSPAQIARFGVAAPGRPDGSHLTEVDYRRAKEALLELVSDLQRTIGSLPSALRWGDRLFWDPDQPKPLIIHHTAATQGAASAFVSALKSKSGVSPEVELRLFDVKSFPQNGAMNFLITDTADAAVREAVTQLDPATRLRPHYPAPGSYAIFEPGEVIVIAGNGPTGVNLGARAFPRFIEGTLEWENEPVPGLMKDSTTPVAYQNQTPAP